jgi:hypothetical protein
MAHMFPPRQQLHAHTDVTITACLVKRSATVITCLECILFIRYPSGNVNCPITYFRYLMLFIHESVGDFSFREAC